MSKSFREPKIKLVFKKKKKRPKMDPYTISSQVWEIQYVADKFNVKPYIVRQVKKSVGKSRQKVYNAIKKLLKK